MSAKERLYASRRSSAHSMKPRRKILQEGMRSTTSRRKFLFQGASVATGCALATPLSGCSLPARASNFDEALFVATLNKSVRHRQCFGNTRLLRGVVLDYMTNAMDAYERELGEGPGTLHAIAVLYGGNSIALAMNDDVWRRYVLPSGVLRQEAGLNLDSNQNTFYEKGGMADSVQRVVARGSHFFVCSNALAHMSNEIGLKMGLPASEVRDNIVSGLVPGAMIVPAGVMAINAAQERHFTYIQVTP